MKAKATVKAWSTSTHQDFDWIQSKIKEGKAVDAISYAMHMTNQDMSDAKGWTEIGVATVTVEFFPREAVVAKQIDGLREQLRQHRIKAEQAEQAILGQISKLTAITG